MKKVLIVSDNMIVDLEDDQNLSPTVTGLLIKDRQLSISLVFISRSCFKLS